jgi:hypothetical protein
VTKSTSAKGEGEGGKRLVKYMGSSDIRELKRGETFEGRLTNGLQVDLVWDWSNHHVLDLHAVPTKDDKGEDTTVSLSDEVIDLIIEDNPGAFLDVTGQEVVEPNEAQRLWRGVGAVRPVINSVDASVPVGGGTIDVSGQTPGTGSGTD